MTAPAGIATASAAKAAPSGVSRTVGAVTPRTLFGDVSLALDLMALLTTD